MSPYVKDLSNILMITQKQPGEKEISGLPCITHKNKGNLQNVKSGSSQITFSKSLL